MEQNGTLAMRLGTSGRGVAVDKGSSSSSELVGAVQLYSWPEGPFDIRGVLRK